MQIANPTQAAPRWIPAALNQTLSGRIAVALAASLFVAVCAHASVRLPFTPVPLTLGDFAVVLVGMALGPVFGFAAMIAYLAEGAAGMPVFNPGGGGGLIQLLGPTGGYLFAYPLAAAAAGALMSSLRRAKVNTFVASLTAAAAGSVIILTCGFAWLAALPHMSLPLALSAGVLPFLPGQLVKIAACAGIYSTLSRWRESKR
jgi:biotin transport system substrate-specific component